MRLSFKELLKKRNKRYKANVKMTDLLNVINEPEIINIIKMVTNDDEILINLDLP